MLTRIIWLVMIGWSSGIEGKRIDTIEESFCRPFPSKVLEGHKISRLDNGSLVHDRLVYPANSYRVVGNETYGCVCNIRLCLRKCCRRDEILGTSIRPNCTRLTNGQLAPDLKLEQRQLTTEIQGISGLSDLFVLVEDMQCPEGTGKFLLQPELYNDDAFVLLANGTLQMTTNKFAAWTYCFDWKESFEKIVAIVCLSNFPPSKDEIRQKSYNIGVIVSIPFFFITFLVYAIIPELRNLYGKTLMCYVASLVVAYTFFILTTISSNLPFTICCTIAFIIHFSFLASFFWLNVMCFDIWWTFGGFRSLQGSMIQRERKKFCIYSIYAWGCALLLTGVCILMDFLPNIPEHFVKPEFGVQSCWFNTNKAKAIYFYGPMGVTVVCNICLFISTALKIVRHKKDTAHHLKGTDSRRHDDNKQWFNLYLKLFIVMGINWSMEIVSWLCNNSPAYIWYLTDLTNTLQGVIIFLIFVWKDKIRRLLLKRLGCHGNNILSRNSTRSAYHSSTSRTTCTSAAPLQQKIIPYSSDPTSRNKTPFVDNDDSV
ncbi:putative G-protein coupled receptor Mth-like 3 isoform X2 [Megachile rotundata]|uniref:putative G-protein coupled receptor Mth-like 3 isoform X2 n=1 Tax=Megachile rotundata TaxID=143995 RepID=UPI000614C564|nr:PREDICTED: probable G-protein coupled receptor Mth-like 3 isoform X2 [Megachile rotundata]